MVSELDGICLGLFVSFQEYPLQEDWLSRGLEKSLITLIKCNKLITIKLQYTITL